MRIREMTVGVQEYINLVSAIRLTAGALRREADYVEPRDGDRAAHLRRRAGAFDRRATEIERQLQPA